MANTFELISSVTVGAGGAATINFTSIPSTYTDLVLKVSGRTTRAADFSDVDLTINGQTSAAARVIYAISGSTVGSYAPSVATVVSAAAANDTANTFGNSEVYIPNYTSTGVKSFSGDTAGENNGANTVLSLAAATITNGAAISSITLTPQAGASWVQYSTAYLYGVKNA